ncbi:MAG: hypothetical protein ACFFDH_08205 [Promethearchaeota archaeon]
MEKRYNEMYIDYKKLNKLNQLLSKEMEKDILFKPEKHPKEIRDLSKILVENTEKYNTDEILKISMKIHDILINEKKIDEVQKLRNKQDNNIKKKYTKKLYEYKVKECYFQALRDYCKNNN